MDEGLALVDEAMVAVVAGELSPIVAGAVYCGVIETSQVVSELRRASEWTAALTAWCGTQPDMVTFTGQCLVHRAELLHLHGAWLEAVEEAKRALERFAHGADEFASGDACYQQAEAYRVLGESGAAEDAYQQASRWGREPQPGLALLRLAQGKTDAAAAAIGRAVAETTDRLRRVKLLPAQVEIMLAAGEVQAALDAADELIQMAGAYSTPALRAMANHARGRCCWPMATPEQPWSRCVAHGSSGASSKRRTRSRESACWLDSPAASSGTGRPRRWNLMPPAPCSHSLAPRQTSPGSRRSSGQAPPRIPMG